MPYTWTRSPSETRLRAWPYRSLPRSGFAFMIGATFLLILMPAFSVLGSPILWGLLPFLMGAVAALWWGLQRSYRDAEILEELTITDNAVRLTRHNPRGPAQDWECNSHWARVEKHPKGGPVEDYLTLRGQGTREVEIGAFLSVPERQTLYGELQQELAQRR